MVNNMKKYCLTLILLIIIFSFVYSVDALSNKKNNINTLNFIEKTSHIPFESIKKICTYDYCDYLRGVDKTSSIELFVNNYIKQKDAETASYLKIKGIQITGIILK